jgi:pyruvate,water dikinase
VSRLEKLFTTPQDVEWAYVGAQLFILQSRPITTAAQQSSTSFEWSRMNFREILPELPSPFSVGIMELSEINFANYYQTLGFKIKDLRPVLKIIYGRPYFNLTLFKYATESTGFPLDFMLRSIGHGEELSTQPDYRINYRKMLASWPIVLRSVIKQSRLKSMLASFLTLTERELAVINGIDVAVIDKVELINQWESRRAYFYQFLAHAITISSAINSTALMLLRNLQSITSEAENFINTQIAIGEKNISAQQGLDLHHLAELAREETPCRNYFISTREEFGDYVSALANTNFLREFEKFLHHYGHRGIHETDIAQPRYGEDPSYLLFTIQHMVNMSPFSTAKELCAQQEKEAEQAWQILAEKLRAKTIFAPLKLHFLRKQLQRLKGLFALRERVRFEGIRVITAARHLHLKFATRLQKEGYITQQEDYFMLQPQDLIAAANRREFHQLQTIIEQRKVRHSFHQKLHLPNLLCDAEIATIPNHTPYIKKQERQQFYGLAVSPGIIEAEVLIIESPLHFTKMKPGRILVAPATDPAWTPLFTLAAGVIVEIGGVLSHGSIVAREYGLPAVVNIPHITHILRDGDRVLLNGNQGTVQIL